MAGDLYAAFERADESVARATGISPAEHAEIDAEIEARAVRAQRVEQLGEYKESIHPDLLMQTAAAFASGEIVGPPKPPPTQDLANIFTQPVGQAVPVGNMVPAARAPEPNISQDRPEEQSMDLSTILGGLSSAAQVYSTVQQARQPAFQPVQQLAPTNPYNNSWQDWLDGPTDWLAPNAPTSLPNAGGPVGCISKRDVEIAQRAGVDPATVDRVLAAARHGRRRRRRMLTKSDLGDIAAAKSIMGNGENFKVWLAKATR